ncbi:hypothetical protein BX600DRAFT_450988 [Xylariales sp. PMI_506]|nr:hypothetical protein BX600DRAFT_450988 [Xylariales sp. PMI_506]
MYINATFSFPVTQKRIYPHTNVPSSVRVAFLSFRLLLHVASNLPTWKGKGGARARPHALSAFQVFPILSLNRHERPLGASVRLLRRRSHTCVFRPIARAPLLLRMQVLYHPKGRGREPGWERRETDRHQSFSGFPYRKWCGADQKAGSGGGGFPIDARASESEQWHEIRTKEANCVEIRCVRGRAILSEVYIHSPARAAHTFPLCVGCFCCLRVEKAGSTLKSAFHPVQGRTGASCF